MREYGTLRSESGGATGTKAFEVRASSTAATAVVQPSGDMDMSNVHLLTSVLAGQLALGRRFVRLDLSRTTASDSSSLHYLVPNHEHFIAARGLLALTNVVRR